MLGGMSLGRHWPSEAGRATSPRGRYHHIPVRPGLQPGEDMSDIKLFRIGGSAAKEIQGAASHLEKPLQSLIETNLDALLGIRFLATEYSTGKTHGGRIDTLGVDENNSPVIIEYKRSSQ